MKAQVISQKVAHGPVPGFETMVVRIVIPEKDNLAITLFDGTLYVFDNFKMDDSCVILKIIDVQKELVEKAIALKKAHDSAKESFEEIFEDYTD